MTNERPIVKILDCTFRDGGYINNWKFEKPQVREAYRALSRAGVDYVEIGFRGTEKHFDKKEFGIWRFSIEEDIREVTANIVGAKIALMADFGKIGKDDFCEAKDSVVKLIRMATHKNTIKEAIKLLEKIKEKGYSVSLNAMGYANYTDGERADLMDLVKRSCLDYLCVADSYGSLFPHQIKSLFQPILGELENIKIGFHPHNGLQMAFANSLEAIRCGVHMVDSTIYGIGRAAGNMPTEIIVSYLEKEGGIRYNSIPILNIIDKYFVAMQREKTWGYKLPYMLSGMFQCHPDYAKALIDMKEYTIEDIWKALEYIKRKKPIGFSKKLLNSVIEEGVIGGLENSKNVPMGKSRPASSEVSESKIEKVPYMNRYKGRDFLILANGPSLKEYKFQIETFIKKYTPVIMGGNYLGNLFVPHYHAFNNKRRLTAYINTVADESILLLGQNLSHALVRDFSEREYERIYYKDILKQDFDIINGVIQTNCRTIAILLMGVATVMGAKRVFGVGMDGYIGMDAKPSYHFYKEQDEKEDMEMIIERHRWCQKFIAQIDDYLHKKGQEGIHILTPTSYKLVYKGIDNYI